MNSTIPNRHSSSAAQAARRLLWRSKLFLLAGVTGVWFACWGFQAAAIPALIMLALWLAFAGFTLFFFRDPLPSVPVEGDLAVAPAHGRVDCVEETIEPEFMGGSCRRISIFLSVFDVHVQNAPVTGKVVFFKHHPGCFLNAMRADSALRNENVLIGLESRERTGERLAVRAIAGLIARRIVSWAGPGEDVARGQRLGLIQFGSRCDLYLPLAWMPSVKPGDRVRGGETIVARRGKTSTPASSASIQSPP